MDMYDYKDGYCVPDDFEIYEQCGHDWFEKLETDDFKNHEKYYWKTKEGKFIKVDDLENNHLKNIVYKFGKDKLDNSGYHNITLKFKELLKNENKEEIN